MYDLAPLASTKPTGVSSWLSYTDRSDQASWVSYSDSPVQKLKCVKDESPSDKNCGALIASSNYMKGSLKSEESTRKCTKRGKGVSSFGSPVTFDNPFSDSETASNHSEDSITSEFTRTVPGSVWERLSARRRGRIQSTRKPNGKRICLRMSACAIVGIKEENDMVSEAEKGKCINPLCGPCEVV